MRYKIKTLNELSDFAAEFLKTTKPGTVVALFGELGSGKTALVKAVGKKLGIKKTIQSPTFSILKIYDVPKGKIKRVCHFDLYRIKNNFKNIGFEECFSYEDSLVFIEWPDMAVSEIPKNRAIKILIEIQKDGSRVITKSRL